MTFQRTGGPGDLLAAPEWDLTGPDPVAVTQWGKDHWTTFLYVANQWVDHRGMLDHDRMRCDRYRHPLLYAAKRRSTAMGTDADGGKYPTRLKSDTPGPDGRWGFRNLPGHDDYDCLNDAITAGLIDVVMPQLREPGGQFFVDAWDRPVRSPDGVAISGLVTGLVEGQLMTAASFRLTERGRVIEGQLRAHVAATRQSYQFMPAGEVA